MNPVCETRFRSIAHNAKELANLTMIQINFIAEHYEREGSGVRRTCLHQELFLPDV